MFDFNPLDLIAGVPGLIIAMVIHEYAHARVAVALGDRTPMLMGRLTLNPAAHIDPVGLIMLFLVRFGWAKPVIIDPRNFRKPRRDDILVSLAGPAANLVTAFLALVDQVELRICSRAVYRARVEDFVARLEKLRLRTYLRNDTGRVVAHDFPLFVQGCSALAHLVVDRIDRHCLDLDKDVAPRRLWLRQFDIDERIFAIDVSRDPIANCFH